MLLFSPNEFSLHAFHENHSRCSIPRFVVTLVMVHYNIAICREPGNKKEFAV